MAHDYYMDIDHDQSSSQPSSDPIEGAHFRIPPPTNPELLRLREEAHSGELYMILYRTGVVGWGTWDTYGVFELSKRRRRRLFRCSASPLNWRSCIYVISYASQAGQGGRISYSSISDTCCDVLINHCSHSSV